MPDFEAILDEASVRLAETPENKAFQLGYIKGKDSARFEVAIIVAIIFFGGAAISYFA